MFRLLLLLLLLSINVWAQPCWVVVHDDNGVAATGVPQPLSDVLHQISAQGHPIKSVFLTHDGGWGVVYGRNAWQGQFSPAMQDLGQALTTAQATNREIRFVAVSPDSDAWAIVMDNRDLLGQRCPEGLVSYANQLSPNSRINSLALGPNRSFYLNHDRGVFRAEGDGAILAAAQELNVRNESPQCAWIGPGTYGLCYARNRMHWVNVSPVLQQQVQQVAAEGGEVQCVAISQNAQNNLQFALASNRKAAVAVTPPVPVSQEAPKMGPSGGNLSASGATVSFPAGALAAEQSAALRVFASPPEPANTNTVLISPAFQLEMDHQRFGQPVTVTLPIDRSKIPAGAENRIHGILGLGPACERVVAQRVDLEKSQVTFQIDRSYTQASMEGPGGGKDYLAVAIDASEYREVLNKPDCIIRGAGPSLAKAQQQAESVYAAFSYIRARYKEMGFDFNRQVEIDLVQMKQGGYRGVATFQGVDYNVDIWNDQDDSKGTLAHELFHVIQNSRAQIFESDNEGFWLNEASAQWMAFNLYPNSSILLSWRALLGRDFVFKDLFSFLRADAQVPDPITKEIPLAPQYQGHVFLAFLNANYDLVAILQKIYPQAQSRQLTGHELLENVVAATLDRSGRRRTLSDVYVDFVIQYLSQKSIAPIKGAPQLGASGELVIPEGIEYFQRCPIPTQAEGRRVYRKTFDKELAPRYGVVSAYTLDSATQGDEKGDLRLQASGAPGLRLVVFPKSGPPIIGRPGQALTLKNWEKQGRATVLVIEAANDGMRSARLTASMPIDSGPVVTITRVWCDPSVLKPGQSAKVQLEYTVEGQSQSANPFKIILTLGRASGNLSGDSSPGPHVASTDLSIPANARAGAVRVRANLAVGPKVLTSSSLATIQVAEKPSQPAVPRGALVLQEPIIEPSHTRWGQDWSWEGGTKVSRDLGYGTLEASWDALPKIFPNDPNGLKITQHLKAGGKGAMFVQGAISAEEAGATVDPVSQRPSALEVEPGKDKGGDSSATVKPALGASEVRIYVGVAYGAYYTYIYKRQ